MRRDPPMRAVLMQFGVRLAGQPNQLSAGVIDLARGESPIPGLSLLNLPT